ncbi:MAG: long-chain-acyl-CoA synthetase [Deltaproteobacteria bacterium]|jgi:citronellyl-CoA synthetase|nr:long-chain-acyl-CoA synthetase [Deltaproteobacteria bacterium]MBT6489024.1 long-chain-acyl-CoA synthetase [Deltaproteobacteria bacterium]
MQIQSIIEELPAVRSRVEMVVKKLPSVIEGLKYLRKTDQEEELSIGSYIERNAIDHPHFPAVLYENQSFSHSTFNAWVNRYANYLASEGIRKGDVVVVLLENRPEVLVSVGALAKLGAVASLINTNQRREALIHSIELSKPRAYIVGEELYTAFSEVLNDVPRENTPLFFLPDTGKMDVPEDFIDLNAVSDRASSDNPLTTGRVKMKDPCFYIFTSGTTGLPKASIMTHFRWVKASAGFGFCALRLKPGEAIYTALPLYHNNALTVAWSSASAGGAAIALRRKFSVSQFWNDTRKFNAVAVCYIGELCRYLLNQPRRPDDAHNPVRRIVGNGLRPDVWMEFKERFDIPEVYEFYGASEGNIAFINLFNLNCTIGFCPLPYAIVKYDIDKDEPLRDSNGRFIKVGKGETGLLLGQVTKKTPFDGYTNKEASEKKLFRDVFDEGDLWFNSGDLLKDMGFRHAQFVDRLGDTFRWKGENVSTTEVDEVANGFYQAEEATTYGVEIPGTDGRAGMISLVLNVALKEFDAKALSESLQSSLPAYALPIFIRLRSELEVTGTFKHRKVDLKEQGFDVNQLKDPVYAWLPGSDSYQKLTKKRYDEIMAKKIRF